MKVIKSEDHIIRDLEDFDQRSGGIFERLLFNNRIVVVSICLLITAILGFQALSLNLNASYESMIPSKHSFVKNYIDNKSDLSSLGNSVRIIVEAKDGNIFQPKYLETLKQINDEVYLIPGVDRPFMKSLWTTSTRWVAVTEQGLEGGTVISDDYDGSAESLNILRENVARSGEIGQLVAANFESSVIFVPLLEKNQITGKPLNYREFNQRIEEIRKKYENDNITIRVTGFTKVIGELIEGLVEILSFFVFAIVIATIMLFWFTRCVRSTLLVVTCSIVAVVWQFGLLHTLGYSLDPYSVLVSFLIFAIGMSHGAQKMNGIMQDVGRGTNKLVAARHTFRRLFAAGLTALLCDAVGFAVLLIIAIKVIQDLAIMASIGVAVLIITNLILLPILLSYVGVSKKAAQRSYLAEQADLTGKKHWLWNFLDFFTSKTGATIAVIGGVILTIVGLVISSNLQVGDLNAGAPELRADSRYNVDNAYMVKNYAASSDIFVVMVKTPTDSCTHYETLSLVDELGWQLEQLPGVEKTNSMANLARMISAGYNEGNFKWIELSPSDAVLGGIQQRAPRELINVDCSMLMLYVYLKDHKAQTLTDVTKTVQTYIDTHNTGEAKFLMAAGNAGIEAATNIVVKKANREMMFWVFAVVTILSWFTFRSWRAVLAAMLPLVMTAILCEAMMVIFGIGVKVATLPVIALGVGIGIDYALYVLSVVLVHMRNGESLSVAYYKALLFTGKVVILTAATLGVGVGFWIMSPIKFQADMGLLLGFMFIWNMLGALILLPALCYFLLEKKRIRDNKINPEAMPVAS
jgi:uncharacterized protein